MTQPIEQQATDAAASQVAASMANPPAHTPLIDRVAKLEQLLAQTISLHNSFAQDVARELGIG